MGLHFFFPRRLCLDLRFIGVWREKIGNDLIYSNTFSHAFSLTWTKPSQIPPTTTTLNYPFFSPFKQQKGTLFIFFCRIQLLNTIPIVTSDLKGTILALQGLPLNTKGCSPNDIHEKYRLSKVIHLPDILWQFVSVYLQFAVSLTISNMR